MSCFFPFVWEQLATAEEFVTALKQKGGWRVEYWSQDIELFKFNVCSIEADYE